MADADSRRGRIIAIDGSRGADLARSSAALAERLRERGLVCGISRWDASGIFNELALAGREERSMSPRTLTLAYVADLAFRLQWEIGPVLAAGGVVIAAPYLETAVSIGMAYGLPESWLRDVLRFAPPADANCLTDERKTASRLAPAAGPRLRGILRVAARAGRGSVQLEAHPQGGDSRVASSTPGPRRGG